MENLSNNDLDKLFEGHRSPQVRGPSFWKVFEHLIIAFEPGVGEVIKSLARHIPCASCMRGMIRYIDKNPFPDNRLDALKWIIDAHNIVNKNNGKDVLSFEEGLKKMSDFIEEKGG